MRKSAILVLGGIILVIGGLVAWGIVRESGTPEASSAPSVPVYSVTYDTKEESSVVSGAKDCVYTAHFNEKDILLGTYPQKGDCSMSQTPTLSNGMLAVITQAYVFLYDPNSEKVIKVDPFAISGFENYTREKGLDLYTDFPQKQFVFNGSTFQILYVRKSEDTKKPRMLIFTSHDQGNIFSFDPNVE